MQSKVTQLTSTLALFAAVALLGSCATEESQETLKAQASITEAQASKTALAKVPTGTIKSSELENENGKLVWSFDISMPGTKNITEVLVDAKTGKIVSVEIETPEQQSKEAEEDQEEAAKKKS